MKKIVYLLLLFPLFFSCNDNDDDKDILSKLTLKIESDKTIEDFSIFQIVITESKSGLKFTGKANAEGSAIFELPMGSYGIVAEDIVDGASTMYGRVDNYTLSGLQAALSVKVQPVENALEKTFVLDELYFNGAKNGVSNTYYEQYFTIRNVSGRPLYADGLSFGICGDFNGLEGGNDFAQFLPDHVVIGQFYTIPGDGRTYKVEPNESLVIAYSAINHNENGNQPNSLDLSGADFEVFVDYEYVQTVDNPEVANVIVNYTVHEAFYWIYSGVMPIMLFRLEEDPATFIANNKINLPNPASMGYMHHDYLKLPTNYIIDGVETGMKDQLYHKVLPTTVDRSAILIECDAYYDGFLEQFVQRKTIVDENGNTTVQDTNNSAEDFIVNVGGQKSYPKQK